MVRGSPRHSESNGGVERVNQTVQKKLGAWMKENKTKHWSIGCKIVQWRYNTQVHQTLRDTPYHLTFGQHPRVGISNLPLSSEILNNLATEAELNDVYSGIQCGMINDSFSPPMEDPTFQAVADAVIDGMSVAEDEYVDMNEATVETRSRTYSSSQDRRNNKRLKTSALGTAIIGNRMENSGALDLTTSPTKGKTCDIDVTKVIWMQLIAERDPLKPVDLSELKSARIRSVFPIVRCINNKDITNVANWEPCILVKVRKETWEVLNVHQTEKVEDDLDLEGDDGLKNTWGLYYRNVSADDEYFSSFVYKTEMSVFDTEKQDVSPKRKSLREKATDNVQKKAESVTKKAISKSPTSSLKLGDVVLVPLSDVDCTKVDGKTLAGVIVTINKDKSTCKVAVKQGLLHRAYVFHALRAVPIASNNRKVMELEDAYLHWQGLPKITEREAARFVSSVGGQGMIKCNCKGDCSTNSCACKKAGRICSSRCHRNSKCCKNNSD